MAGFLHPPRLGFDVLPPSGETAVMADQEQSKPQPTKKADWERIEQDYRALDETSIEDLDATMGNWEARSGQPRQYLFMQTVGAGHPALQLVPIPTSAGEISLRVYRGPINKLKPESACLVPEIPIRHHHKLVNWVARCAFLRPDADGHDADRAQMHEGYFERDFGARPDANVQRKRRDKRPRLVKSHW